LASGSIRRQVARWRPCASLADRQACWRLWARETDDGRLRKKGEVLGRPAVRRVMQATNPQERGFRGPSDRARPARHKDATFKKPIASAERPVAGIEKTPAFEKAASAPGKMMVGWDKHSAVPPVPRRVRTPEWWDCTPLVPSYKSQEGDYETPVTIKQPAPRPGVGS